MHVPCFKGSRRDTSFDVMVLSNLQTSVGFFDATKHFNAVGRYINHAYRGVNLLLKKPLKVRGKWRIGFVAKTWINAGVELFWDYGFR